MPGRPEALAALWTPWRYYSASYFDLVAPTTFGGRARDGVESAQREVRLGRPPSMIGYGQQLLALAGWSSLPWLHQIAAPTLVICGDDDPIVPVVNGRVLARRIPRAGLAVVRGAGHLMLLDSAPDVVPLIQEFLAAPDP